MAYTAWDWGNTAIVALLVAGWILLERADNADLFATALHRARVRAGRQVPPGFHRVSEGFSVRVGRPDTILVFKLPLQAPGEQRTRLHIGVTDAATHFTVRNADATLDEFLEAYDDELGPLDFEVYVPGTFAAVGIASDGTPPLTREVLT